MVLERWLVRKCKANTRALIGQIYSYVFFLILVSGIMDYTKQNSTTSPFFLFFVVLAQKFIFRRQPSRNFGRWYFFCLAFCFFVSSNSKAGFAALFFLLLIQSHPRLCTKIVFFFLSFFHEPGFLLLMHFLVFFFGPNVHIICCNVAFLSIGYFLLFDFFCVRACAPVSPRGRSSFVFFYV